MAEQQDGSEREPQPMDEEAAWAAIVAGYGEEPADPPPGFAGGSPGLRPVRPVEDLALPDLPDDLPDAEESASPDGAATAPPEKPDKFRRPRPAEDEKDEPEEPGDAPALGSSIVFAPGVRLGGGPRDYSLADPDEAASGDGASGADEGHFIPPEPPPLPEADTTTKFAWLAVVGGPVLMLLAVLLQWDMTWWLTTLCVGGFLGGFVTLVARMKGDDEDDDGFDDPGRGAVV